MITAKRLVLLLLTAIVIASVGCGSSDFNPSSFKKSTKVPTPVPRPTHVTTPRPTNTPTPYTYQTMISTIGTWDSGPHRITTDNSGNIYVCDGGSRIQLFDPQGNYVSDWGTAGRANREEKVGVFCEDSRGRSVSGNNPEGKVGDIAVDSFGNVYISKDSWRAILKFDPQGNYLFSWEGRARQGLGLDGEYYSGDYDDYRFIEGIAVDNSDRIYVADREFRVFIHDIATATDESGGKTLHVWSGPICCDPTESSLLFNPTDVAVDQYGNVYVADDYVNRIQKFDSQGNFLLSWGNPGGVASGENVDGEFAEPNSIALDKFGNVYVADYRMGRIQKFDSQGNFLAKWGQLEPFDNYSDDTIAMRPIGLVVDKSGQYIYVIDHQTNTLQKYPSGN